MTSVPGDPFIPRHRGGSAVKAIENFTDREEALAAFARHLDAPPDRVLPVLHFYGVGGIGKTSLVHKLVSDLSAEATPIPHALLDLREARDRDPVRALTILRVALGRFGVPFDRFDLISGVLAASEGAGEAELFQLSPWARAASEVVLQLPMVGAPLSAGKAALEHVLPGLLQKHSGLREWLERVGGSDELQRLRRLPREDLLYELVGALAADLSEGAPERPDHACRAVIFIDTYEALWTNLAGPTSPQGTGVDEWVRELFAHLHPANAVLLVIAGRDQLCWPEVDDRWRQVRARGDICDFLDAHLIGGLSPTDTQRYLGLSGVGHGPEVGAPTPLQSAIIDCASRGLEDEGCHPAFVGLCVDIVHIERGPDGPGADPPEEWFRRGARNEAVAGKLRELAKLLLTSLSGNDLPELVKRLSVARWFDQALVAERLGSDVLGDAAYTRLEQFSFTAPRQGGGLTFHPLMREALFYLLGHGHPQRVADLHRWYREHWQARHAAGEASAEEEAWYHLMHHEPERAVEAWTNAACAARDARDGARARALLTWWDDLDLTDEEWRERVGDEAWARLLAAQADWLQLLRPFALDHGPLLLRAIACYQAALRVYSEEAFPAGWAMIQNDLGNSYLILPTGDRAENLARAIACYQAALRVCTEEAFPAHWARIQNNLANAYQGLPADDRGENLASAIDCYEAALRVYTEEAFPAQWATIQNNLGIAHLSLPTGNRAKNLARAIDCHQAALRVYTEEAFPEGWAMTQINLGHAHANLPTDRGGSLAEAIACYHAALRVYTEEAFPALWATTQYNLGHAYADLPTDNLGENLARAIACYQAALRVWTEDIFPAQWAMTQNNLGNLYANLPTGDRRQNLAQAIACYHAALRIYTEEAFPAQWAMTQSSLANAYANLPTGDRGQNLAQAIACYHATLQIYTEEAFAAEWAMTQYNLGNAYSDLPTGDRAENLARAIARYQAALRVRTEEAFPAEWARTQNNLGAAYHALPTGDRGQNRARAIDCFEAALRVYTEEAFPADWARTQNNLANAYRNLPTGDRAENLARAIACYQAALRVLTEGTFPDQWATVRYNLACAYALSGRAEEALGGLQVVIRANPDKYVPMAREDEDFASLRDDPRFQRLLDGGHVPRDGGVDGE